MINLNRWCLFADLLFTYSPFGRVRVEEARESFYKSIAAGELNATHPIIKLFTIPKCIKCRILEVLEAFQV